MLPVFVRAADHGKSQRIVIILIGLINATCYQARLLSENDVIMKPYLRLIRQDGTREFFAGTNDVLSQWLVLFNIHACMLTCVWHSIICMRKLGKARMYPHSRWPDACIFSSGNIASTDLTVPCMARTFAKHAPQAMRTCSHRHLISD